MKLLNKSEQSKAKALEQNRDIQEGLKLAKRVDALREMSAQEDKALKDFRKNTLEEISRDILKKSAERDALVEEVKILEDRKLEAVKTLDLEWDKVKLAQESITLKEEALSAQIEAITAQESEINQKLREITVKEAQIDTLKIITEQKLQEADMKLQESKDTSNTSQEILLLAQARAKELIINAEVKEKYIINREKIVFLKEEELRKKEIDLAIQESALKDKYATLERSINRLKK